MPQRLRLGQIDDSTILEMDTRNREAINDLKVSLKQNTDCLNALNITITRIDERLKDQKDIEDDVENLKAAHNQIKGVGTAAGAIFGLSEIIHWIYSIFKH